VITVLDLAHHTSYMQFINIHCLF